MNAIPWLVSRRILTGAFALVVSLGLTPARAATDEEAVHEQLRQLKTTYETAINSGNLAPLESLFSPATTGVVVDNQPFKSYADLQSIYARFNASFPGATYRIKLNPERSLIFGNIAVAYGTGEEYVKTADGEFTYTSSFTAVLQQEGKEWKLIRSQVTMDPFKNSVVQYFISRTKLYVGGGALVGGLLVGFMLGRLSGAKKGAAA